MSKEKAEPWLCWLGIHKWGLWRPIKVAVTKNGEPMGTYDAQARTCLRCRKEDDRAI